MTRLVARGLVLAALFGLVGCATESLPENLPKLFPVAIKVTQDGVPLEGAFVRLVPARESMPWNCGGTTDSSGVATIRAVGKYDGAPEGAYLVVVSKVDMGQAGPSGTDLSNLDAQPPKRSESYGLIDPKFANPSKTPLKLTVSSETSSHEFDVGPAVHVRQQVPR